MPGKHLLTYPTQESRKESNEFKVRETHTNKGATEIVRYRKPAISSGLNWSTPDGEACSACPPGSVWSIMSNKLIPVPYTTKPT